ncbi:hypothetical protein HPB47_027942 [Ixodes persulcatus]|uniref:Uncharacterized protein n=1 Tax=Ixodes persulcatus TaxID=34615 RepID=A0AC60PVS3_IXOPE|nr:hypothetical protein HPB47_027942 [Ixodes persulcatus]
MLPRWVNLVGTAVVFGALLYWRFPMTIPYRYSLHLLLTALATSAVLSALLYVKGRTARRDHRHPAGNTGNVLHDFVFGRELSPRIGELYDLATLSFRCGLLGWAVLLGSMAWHEYRQHNGIDRAFALSAGCQLLYICFVVLHEEYFLSSVFVTEDALGYVAMTSNLVALPFLGALPAKFLLEHRQGLAPHRLAAILVLFATGLAIVHLSQKSKYAFRRNWPDSAPRGQGFDFVADSAGNRLLVSGLWGLVRHPNYLGDLVCTLAFALPCGFGHVLPYYHLLLCLLFLAARAAEVEARCRQRYGDLWLRYARRVKYRLLPGVY